MTKGARENVFRENVFQASKVSMHYSVVPHIVFCDV